MFLINSCLDLVIATLEISKVLLLPKLRSHFAEFLQSGSLKRFSLFDLADLCRFRVRFVFYKLFPGDYIF